MSRVIITDHALLRYAERCYGEVYSRVAEIPSEIATRYRAELEANVASATELTLAQGKKLASLRKHNGANRGLSGIYRYKDDVLTVLTLKSGASCVLSVLPIEPRQMRYLEEIGVREVGRVKGFRLESYEFEVLVHSDDSSLPDPELVKEWIGRTKTRRCKLFASSRQLSHLRHLVRSSDRQAGCEVRQLPIPSGSMTEGAERALRDWVKNCLLNIKARRIFVICDAQLLARLIALVYEGRELPVSLLQAPTASGFVHAFSIKEGCVDGYVTVRGPEL